MPSIYQLKPAFQGLLRPLVVRLAAWGVSANAVTLTASALSLALGAALAWSQAPKMFLLVPVWMFLRMALNAIDGMLAREHNMKTRLGALLNELTDVLNDAALFLPFALLPGVSAPLVVLITVAAALTELAGVAATTIGASRRYDGPMGKSDRAFAFGLLSLLLGLGVPAGLWTQGLLGLVLALTAWTVINRMRRALGEQTA